MAQINSCLKRVFTIFNIFFAVVGGLILGLTLLSHILIVNHGGGQLEGRVFGLILGLILLYIMGAVTMVIATVGAYGAHKENRVCLIVFLVCMVIGSSITLRFGVSTTIFRPELRRMMHDTFSEMLPLDQASQDVKDMAGEMQRQLHCCGLFSYKDWEGNIPESCLCIEDTAECQPDPYESVMLFSKSIYSKPCFPIIIHYILLAMDIMIGVVFTLAVLAILGVALSSIMIHQMRYPSRPATVLTVPAIFTTAPPKYQELHNAPLY